MKRKIIIGAAAFLGFLALVTTRVVCSSRAEYFKAKDAIQRVKIDLAITHYRRAARWYAPGNSYVTRSMDALWELGRQAEDKGDVATALKCYRAIRGAILGARSFYTPHSERLGPVNRRIARLMAAQQTSNEAHQYSRSHASTAGGGGSPGGAKQPGQKGVNVPAQGPGKGGPPRAVADPAGRRAALAKWHLDQLKKTNAPSVGWSILAVLGFLVWVGSAFAFAYKAISPDDRLLNKPALIWGGVIVCGLVMWMLGLSMA